MALANEKKLTFGGLRQVEEMFGIEDHSLAPSWENWNQKINAWMAAVGFRHHTKHHWVVMGLSEATCGTQLQVVEQRIKQAEKANRTGQRLTGRGGYVGGGLAGDRQEGR